MLTCCRNTVLASGPSFHNDIIPVNALDNRPGHSFNCAVPVLFLLDPLAMPPAPLDRPDPSAGAIVMVLPTSVMLMLSHADVRRGL